ncbi:MAG: glycosyltransferase family 8 protein [Lachnospiraceae bacterium]|nr:glycosyltransferase family 8 protein [Lachnospiraceae bacterium]
MGRFLMPIYGKVKSNIFNPWGILLGMNSVISKIFGDKDKRKISIVLCTDAGYLLPSLVAIESIYMHKASETSLDIHILLDGMISEKEWSYIEIMKNRYKGITIHPVSHKYEEAPITLAHTTKSTFLRLMLPSFFPDIDKCIYLDGDLIVNSDLYSLYNVNMNRSYVAGVRAATYYKDISKTRKRLGIPKNIRNFEYINAGILLLDLKRMRKDGMEEKFNALVDRPFEMQDQDIINKVCSGRIKIIDLKYNAVVKYGLLNPSLYEEMPHYQVAYKRKEYLNACDNPAIIHFAGKKKPWLYPEEDYRRLWWETAKRLPFYEDIRTEYNYASTEA